MAGAAKTHKIKSLGEKIKEKDDSTQTKRDRHNYILEDC